MAWQRKIPFGYTMKNGEVEYCPAESAAVKEIFAAYLSGMAYSKIAEEMMGKGILYHRHTPHWNKNMVKRILENERYLGEKEYPPIIAAEDFMAVQLCKNEKVTYAPSSDYIQPIREKAVCGECGGRMLRDTKSAGRVRWYCENKDCQNRRYIEDADTRTALAEKLTVLAQNPHLLEWAPARYAGEQTLEAARIQNEITRQLNKADPSVEYTKMLILACAAEKYSELPDYTHYRQMERLREKLGSQPIDELLLTEMFNLAVEKIEWTADGGMRLRLKNGKALEAAGKES